MVTIISGKNFHFYHYNVANKIRNIFPITGANKDGAFQGLCIWFECVFPDLSDNANHNPVRLDTGPLSTPTHWKQTVIILPEEQEVELGDPIAFQLEMCRDSVNKRR